MNTQQIIMKFKYKNELYCLFIVAQHLLLLLTTFMETIIMSDGTASSSQEIYCKNAIQPLHGRIVRNLINKETRKKLWKKLDGMPSSDTWYGDIYEKAIYGPMIFRDKDFLDLKKIVEEDMFPGYRILADLYLEKTPQDDGFPFHTDFDSNGFMERPEEMITLWIPLTPVLQKGSGQLSIVTTEGAIRLSLIRVANQLHSLTRVVDTTIPNHPPFQMTNQEVQYMERTKYTPSLLAGDALVFCNAFFHKSEPVQQGTEGLIDGVKRASYIMRLVPKEKCKFSKTRLLGLKSLGQNLNVVNELLQENYPNEEASSSQNNKIPRSEF